MLVSYNTLASTAFGAANAGLYKKEDVSLQTAADVEALATGDVELLDEEPLQVGSGEVEELDAELLDGAEMLEDAELLA